MKRRAAAQAEIVRSLPIEDTERGPFDAFVEAAEAVTEADADELDEALTRARTAADAAGLEVCGR